MKIPSAPLKTTGLCLVAIGLASCGSLNIPIGKVFPKTATTPTADEAQEGGDDEGGYKKIGESNHEEGGIVLYRGSLTGLGEFFPDTFKSKKTYDNSAAANELYTKAGEAYKAGKTKKALELYQELANRYPETSQAPLARYNEGLLLEETGKLVAAFDAYQEFITTYFGTSLYADALSRQETVAHAAASGKFRRKFLGLTSRIDRETVEKMLKKVIANAPQAESAPRAQYTIGQIWEERKEYDDALAGYKAVPRSYPDSPYAAEALYRIGTIYFQQSTTGNRNNANLDTARNTYTELITLFPTHPKAKEAKKKLGQIGGLSVQRSLDIAEFYRKKGQIKSAKFYYNEVIRLAPKGSPLHTKATERLNSL